MTNDENAVKRVDFINQFENEQFLLKQELKWVNMIKICKLRIVVACS